jgi:hypothetical protein
VLLSVILYTSCLFPCVCLILNYQFAPSFVLLHTKAVLMGLVQMRPISPLPHQLPTSPFSAQLMLKIRYIHVLQVKVSVLLITDVCIQYVNTHCRANREAYTLSSLWQKWTRTSLELTFWLDKSSRRRCSPVCMPHCSNCYLVASLTNLAT